jgi:hypothetical protein
VVTIIIRLAGLPLSATLGPLQAECNLLEQGFIHAITFPLRQLQCIKDDGVERTSVGLLYFLEDRQDWSVGDGEECGCETCFVNGSRVYHPHMAILCSIGIQHALPLTGSAHNFELEGVEGIVQQTSQREWFMFLRNAVQKIVATAETILR